jgi:hypothetical protein
LETSIQAHTLPEPVSSARKESARLVGPEHSPPTNSVNVPMGSPPSKTSSTERMPVGVTGRMVLAGGVSAEGMRSARAASTWERIVAAEGIAKYIRLMFAYSVRRLQLRLAPMSGLSSATL